MDVSSSTSSPGVDLDDGPLNGLPTEFDNDPWLTMSPSADRVLEVVVIMKT